jgi:SNF2 family DNA or RNA helicase
VASLHLLLDPQRGVVEIRRGAATSDREWTSLRVAWPEAVSIGSGSVELELYRFLERVDWLADWPHSDDVQWEPVLLETVERSFEQSSHLREVLSGSAAVPVNAARELSASPRWVGDLKPFQLRDIEKLATLDNGANFSVPGAGKTRSTLAVYEICRLRQQVGQLLVVAPLSAHETWRDECRVVYSKSPTIETLQGGSPSPTTEVVLLNYERLPSLQASLAAWCLRTRTMIVLDEAHRVKRGSRGVYGSIVLSLAPRAARRCVLTGTPAPQGVEDLATLMQFLWLGQARNVISRVTSARSLSDASRTLTPLFARTTKRELNLPPLRLKVRRVDALELHAQIYQALCGLYVGQLALGNRDMQSIGRVVMYLLMAATNPALLRAGTDRHDALDYSVPPIDVPVGASLSDLLSDLPYYEAPAKYAEVVSIVEANAGRNRKTLVWSTFVRNIESLAPILQRFGPAAIHGGTLDRDAQLQRFRADPDCWVLISNPATMGEGVSLHETCGDAVYLDRDFAAGKFMQSVDRIHRLGLAPDAEVNATILVTPGTIDEIVDTRLAQKIGFMGTLLDDPAVNDLAAPDEEEAAVYGLSQQDVASVVTHIQG